MSDSPSGNRQHDANVAGAKQALQLARTAGASQATLQAADIAYHGAVAASAQKYGVGEGGARVALLSLGVNFPRTVVLGDGSTVILS